MIHLREANLHLLNAPKISDRDEEILNLSLKQIKSLIWVRITQLNQLKLFTLAEVEGQDILWSNELKRYQVWALNLLRTFLKNAVYRLIELQSLC